MRNLILSLILAAASAFGQGVVLPPPTDNQTAVTQWSYNPALTNVDYNGMNATGIVAVIGTNGLSIDLNTGELGGAWPIETDVVNTGLGATNLALAVGAGATNYADAVGAAVGLGATNLSLAIGAGATNYANTVGAAVGLGATNLSLAIGAGATNYADTVGAAVGLGATNLALAVGAGATALVQTATANMATGGQWNASVAGASNLALSVGAGATSVAYSASANWSTNPSVGSVTITGDITGDNQDDITGFDSIVPYVGSPHWIDLENGVVTGFTVAGYVSDVSLHEAKSNAFISGIHTNTGFPWLTNAAFIAGYDAVEFASRAYVAIGRTKNMDYYRGIRWNNTIGQWEDVGYSAGVTNRILTTGNFSSSSYVSAYEATNFVRVFQGSVTQDQSGQVRDLWVQPASTHVWVNIGTTNWLYIGGVKNVFP